MKYVGYYNGELGDLNEMKIPMLDRAVFFGDGCYDATTFAHNRIFATDDHLDRFYNSCRQLEIPFEMPREALVAALQACVDANELDSGMVYWQCSRGTGLRSHAFPPMGVQPNLLIFTVPYEMASDEATFRLISMEDIRFYMCNVKTLNLIPNVLACQRSAEAGCQETVFYRREFGRKRVTECSHSNILMLRDGALHTPPLDNLILPGIALKHLLALARQEGIPVRERPFTLEELADADEVIVSSSGSLCVRAVELDGQRLGGRDEVTFRRLQRAYRAYYTMQTEG